MKMREVVSKRLIPPLGKRAAAKWARFTEESNKEFQALSPAKKRAWIANDVIAQVKVKMLIAEWGTYVDSHGCPEGDVEEALRGVDLGVALPYIGPCNVRAVGSIMICTIMRDDNFSYSGYGLNFDGDEAYKEARRFFTDSQLNTMEELFEGWSSQRYSYEPWFPESLDANAILILIMQHVVDTDGSITHASFDAWLKRRYERYNKKTTKKLASQSSA